MKTHNIQMLRDSIGGQISTSEDLIDNFEKRQKQIFKSLLAYFQTSIILALFIMFAVIALSPMTGWVPEPLKALIDQPWSFNRFLSTLFISFAHLFNIVFFIWAFSFIPFISMKAYKASHDISVHLRPNRFKWINLFAAIILPFLVFIFFFQNAPKTTDVFTIKMTINEGILMVVGAIILWLFLMMTTLFIPFKYPAIHLSIYSLVLYLTIALSYYFGYGIFTYSAFIAILMFLTQQARRLGEIIRQISMYDIDSNIVEKIITITNQEDLISVKYMKAEMDIHEQKQKHEIEMVGQLQEIQSSKININAKVNKIKLNCLNKQLGFLDDIYSIYSKKYEIYFGKELPDLINKYKQDVENLTLEQISNRVNEIIFQVNYSLDSIPKSLNHIKSEMNEISNKIVEEARNLAIDND